MEVSCGALRLAGSHLLSNLHDVACEPTAGTCSNLLTGLGAGPQAMKCCYSVAKSAMPSAFVLRHRSNRASNSRAVLLAGYATPFRGVAGGAAAPQAMRCVASGICSTAEMTMTNAVLSGIAPTGRQMVQQCCLQAMLHPRWRQRPSSTPHSCSTRECVRALMHLGSVTGSLSSYLKPYPSF